MRQATERISPLILSAHPTLVSRCERHKRQRGQLWHGSHGAEPAAWTRPRDSAVSRVQEALWPPCHSKLATALANSGSARGTCNMHCNREDTQRIRFGSTRSTSIKFNLFGSNQMGMRDEVSKEAVSSHSLMFHAYAAVAQLVGPVHCGIHRNDFYP